MQQQDMLDEWINFEPFMKNIEERYKEIEPFIFDDLTHFENYGDYSSLVNTGRVGINTISLNRDNIDTHWSWIYNILVDGIEQDKVHNMVIDITFADGVQLYLSIFDYFLNLIMWKLPLLAGDQITSRFLFFDDCITQHTIKNYIDHFIDIHRTDISNHDINNMIDDTQ